MLWTIMLLAVGICGILGFYDSLYGFGELMRMLNSGILILLSLGLLLRTWVKRNLRNISGGDRYPAIKLMLYENP